MGNGATVRVSVKGQAAFPVLLPCGGAAPSGRVSEAVVADGTACRVFLRALPRMEIALLVMMMVLASA